jgi:hypothetical protein
MDRPTLRARTADTRRAELGGRLALAERPLERAELGVGPGRVLHLRFDEVRPLASEAMELQHEPADVPQLELAQPAQVAGAPSKAAALA